MTVSQKKLDNPYDIYKLLNKSNCRQCMLPSCMAFAVALVQGQKKPADCPYLDADTAASLGGDSQKRKTLEDEHDRVYGELKSAIRAINLSETANRLGVKYISGKIGINCLGKDFWVDSSGEMISECHSNHWVNLPLLRYILHGKGTVLKGDWINFGALKGSTKAWNQYFSHRCEGALRQLADAHQDLLFEILDMFGAKTMKGATNADFSMVIEPFPNVQIMINYWPPEDDFESQLTLLFDSNTTDNLDLDSLYLACRGLVEMFRELIVKHSRDGKLF